MSLVVCCAPMHACISDLIRKVIQARSNKRKRCHEDVSESSKRYSKAVIVMPLTSSLVRVEKSNGLQAASQRQANQTEWEAQQIRVQADRLRARDREMEELSQLVGHERAQNYKTLYSMRRELLKKLEENSDTSDDDDDNGDDGDDEEDDDTTNAGTFAALLSSTRDPDVASCTCLQQVVQWSDIVSYYPISHATVESLRAAERILSRMLSCTYCLPSTASCYSNVDIALVFVQFYKQCASKWMAYGRWLREQAREMDNSKMPQPLFMPPMGTMGGNVTLNFSKRNYRKIILLGLGRDIDGIVSLSRYFVAKIGLHHIRSHLECAEDRCLSHGPNERCHFDNRAPKDSWCYRVVGEIKQTGKELKAELKTALGKR